MPCCCLLPLVFLTGCKTSTIESRKQERSAAYIHLADRRARRCGRRPYSRGYECRRGLHVVGQAGADPGERDGAGDTSPPGSTRAGGCRRSVTGPTGPWGRAGMPVRNASWRATTILGPTSVRKSRLWTASSSSGAHSPDPPIERQPVEPWSESLAQRWGNDSNCPRLSLRDASDRLCPPRRGSLGA